MSKWLKFNCTHPHIINVYETDVYGGKEINISLAPHIVDLLTWLQHYKTSLEQEQRIREQDAAARELYQQYDTYVKLTYNK